MRAKSWILGFICLLLAPLTLRAAGLACGEHDLMFGCTQTEEKGRLRAGCGVHDGGKFFASEWRIYELESEKVLGRSRSGKDGIALVAIPKGRWFILEGELVCSRNTNEVAIPYRFLLERTGKNSFLQRPYTPENLVSTGNWSPDSQLNYGAFRSRSALGTASGGTTNR